MIKFKTMNQSEQIVKYRTFLKFLKDENERLKSELIRVKTNAIPKDFVSGMLLSKPKRNLVKEVNFLNNKINRIKKNINDIKKLDVDLTDSSFRKCTISILDDMINFINEDRINHK